MSSADSKSKKIVDRSEQVANPKLQRKLAAKPKKPRPREQDVPGQAAAAQKNREREARRYIIQTLFRLGIRPDVWPDFVRVFHTDPRQRTEYQQPLLATPFQPPEFDRLNQSSEDWAELADRAWELHRKEFLQMAEFWVAAGVDEEIVAVKHSRGPGKKMGAPIGSQKRGDNTPIHRRYEWAAKYLIKVPLKQIAGVEAEKSTVGRVAREIVQLAGWPTKRD